MTRSTWPPMVETPPLDKAQRPLGQAVARMLLEAEAVLLRPEQPFTLTSGRQSPVYVDCRRLISYPRIRRRLIAEGTNMLTREVGFEQFDAVAGGETAGIPFAAWFAERLMLPMLYVRKKPKGFGRNALIEGVASEGARVLLVEDLATDGGSKLHFIDGLRAAGFACAHVFVIFRYGIFPAGERALEDASVRLHALASWADVLSVVKGQNLLPAEGLDAVERFLRDPDNWTP